jgi:porin
MTQEDRDMRRSVVVLVGALLLITVNGALAQETEKADLETRPEPASPYAGSWTEWERATGDWGGLRTDLEEIGISLELDVTQIVQSNTYGGIDTNSGTKYSGTADLTITLDTQKMGLWPGGQFVFLGEPKWGDGVNEKAALLPVNLDAAKPNTGDSCQMTLSEFFYVQGLFEGKLIMLIGKLDGSRAFDLNEFANNEKTQFMNVALRNYPVIPSFLPYTVHGIGAIYNATDWLTYKVAVTDSEGRNDTTGFETTFHGPTHTSVINEVDVKVEPFGLPGNQRFGVIWSSMEKPTLGGRGTEPDSTAIYYNFDQYVYTESDDPSQGVGLFGRFGWTRRFSHPIEYFYSLGVGGKGIIPTRDNDTFGLGYFHADISNQMPAPFNQEAGVELFYNIEVFPWMHITPDLQVIADPGGMNDNNDPAIVAGIRVHVNL